MKKKLQISLALGCILFCSLQLKSQSRLYANEFDLSEIQLLDGPFKQARDLNIKVLLQYDVDRLLAPYLKEAGLPPKADSYPNWIGLDGHVGGHYLTAMAMNYEATGNLECKRRMDYMLSELKICQEANAKNNPEWAVGYIGGVPNSAELWNTFKNGDFDNYFSKWVPFYNVHKMYAGLRDSWLYTGNDLGKEMFLAFCDWAINLTQNLTDEQMETVLDMEHGGMNESFADAYQMTGDPKYLLAAQRFSHKDFLEPASKGVDNLDNKHANTQIPKFVGFERIAEVSKNDQYDDASQFFWNTVTKERSLAIGGNSRREHFPNKEVTIDYIYEDEGPETCNSYNMLKLTEDLFRQHPEAKYVDYYERTLYNHILSSQHPEHGGYVYFTPTRPRHYRVYSAPNQAMWCCVGSGMENHGKYNQFIYTRADESLYVNLFIASELNWKDKNVKIRQDTDFPFKGQTKLTIVEGAAKFKLKIRYPGWVDQGTLKITINGEEQVFDGMPSSYVTLDRKWKKGDVMEMELPMKITTESLPNVPEYVAFLNGPIVLGASTGTEDLKGIIADDSRFGQIPMGEKLPIDLAPILIDDNIDLIGNKLIPIENQPLNYSLNIDDSKDINLKPFFQIHDARYMLYWLTLTNSQYESYTDSLAGIEAEKLAIEKRTVDFVTPGEQQPEADHLMQMENSTSGNNLNQFYRIARSEGYFSYELATGSAKQLSLLVRYFGAEWGKRKFDIYIDDEKLLTEDNTGRWNIAIMQDVLYPIPNGMIKDKNSIRIKFQALPENTAGGVYSIRLIKNQTE
ncbi:MAG: glycoside hydrolase family 127 protein [Cyclobacteriaceae bacterium]